jgi:diadenosine tetraphosphate (Ap4A) HIT family hydrolase
MLEYSRRFALIIMPAIWLRASAKTKLRSLLNRYNEALIKAEAAMSDFQLHHQLAQDCFKVGSFSLSELLMMNDSQYPWFILVPRRANVKEIYQLSAQDRQTLQSESCLLAETLADLYRPDKLNIAAIGNLVPQLHLHHVVRYQTDIAWPAPVWGKFAKLPYAGEQPEQRISQLRTALANELHDGY